MAVGDLEVLSRGVGSIFCRFRHATTQYYAMSTSQIIHTPHSRDHYSYDARSS
jgi:hypothetical protein